MWGNYTSADADEEHVWTIEERNINRINLRKYWNTFKAVASGDMDKSMLTKEWMMHLSTNKNIPKSKQSTAEESRHAKNI